MSIDNSIETLVFDSTVVSGDKGVFSLFDDEVLIHVDSSHCYRVLVYKVDFNFD